MLCSGWFFCLYFKSSVRWPPHPEATEDSSTVCTDACLSVLKVDSTTHFLHSNSTLNYSARKQQKKHLMMDLVPLIWTVYLYSEPSTSRLDLVPLFWKCYLLSGPGTSHLDLVPLFWLRDIGGELSYLLTLSRPPLQKWVWMNMESPANSPQLPGADDLFNLTSNYRRDSDIWVPYGQLVEASEEDKTFQIPMKDKLVCWIVSNWNNNYKRVSYFNELSKYINIEVYGQHFGKYINKEDYFKIMSSCKFYLAFENSIYKDYMSDKLYHPMRYGTVPVVLGPPRENYEEFVPGNSFIHVDDFESPKEMADLLKLLDQNQEMYEQYFTWKKYFTVKGSAFGLEHACRICEHLKKNKNFRIHDRASALAFFNPGLKVIWKNNGHLA
ncbi:hypothetical protein P4O66_002696 [Electrophorus voltai]|uniref:Fucosyltransferase n=1 Tax=Electrophorus voltai TaxID=2609070 RepID=A0AAD9DNV6_9TELE|nr:hypothetical protein P4O66_002696 [Electrophorus voltai]